MPPVTEEERVESLVLSMDINGFPCPNQKVLHFVRRGFAFHNICVISDREALNPTLHGLSWVCFGDETWVSQPPHVGRTALICRDALTSEHLARRVHLNGYQNLAVASTSLFLYCKSLCLHMEGLGLSA